MLTISLPWQGCDKIVSVLDTVRAILLESLVLFMIFVVRLLLKISSRVDQGVSIKMAQNSRPSAIYFNCPLKDLKDVMQLRGPAAYEAVQSKYGGVEGLCKLLKTSPIEGLHHFVQSYIS